MTGRAMAKQRYCLKCDKPIPDHGPNWRLCPACRQANARLSHAEAYGMRGLLRPGVAILAGGDRARQAAP